MTRKPLISGNWKMNYTHLEAIAAVQKLSYHLSDADYRAVDVSVHPPFTSLRSVQTVLDADDIPIALGAQNTYWESKGAFTGEVSPQMLQKLNVKYVIVGHSERRQHFGETDADVAKKLRAVLAAGMVPICCVGETIDEREEDRAKERVTLQVGSAIAGVDADAVGGLVIAYEPIWAIGTGRNATASDAQDMCAAIRGTVADLVGNEAAANVRIQYGGSVKESNIAEFMAEKDIDGALVGGASLDPEGFASLITYGRR
jgi:triosephosphate isomerase